MRALVHGYMWIGDKERATVEKALDKFQSKGNVARIMGYYSTRGNSSTIKRIIEGKTKQMRKNGYERLVQALKS